MELAEQLRQARWFGGKSRTISDARVVDRACCVADAPLLLVDVSYTSGPPDTYVMVEGLGDPSTARAVLGAFQGADVATDAGQRLEFRPTHVLERLEQKRTEPVALMRAEQSNTSIRYGDALMLKLFRRLQFGPNPDVEVGWFLTEHSQFRGTPAVAGSLDYVRDDGQRASLALLQEFVVNRGDAWSTIRARLSEVLHGGDMSSSLTSIERLALTTADLHVALGGGDADFAPEATDAGDVAAWRAAIHAEVAHASDGLARRQIAIDTGALLRRADGIDGLLGAAKIRHHGDYHLGQVLEREDGSFVVIDFEGEPSKPLAQRREKRSPLRDVAGMLRSLDYARHVAVQSAGTDAEATDHVQIAGAWYSAARQAFLDAYLREIRNASPALLPTDVEAPLAALELEKAAYEVSYELNNRPDWLPIPLAAMGDTECR